MFINTFFACSILLLNCLTALSQKPYHDQSQLLDDKKVNPKFAALIKRFLDSAKVAGFKPVIHEAYRSPLRAQKLKKENAQSGRTTASVSVHSFGLAADIWLANNRGDVFSFDPKDYRLNKDYRFSYATWKKFIRIGERLGLINADRHSDSDHWEYHPAWDKTDWVSASEVILPIYNKYKGLSDSARLQRVWTAAGL